MHMTRREFLQALAVAAASGFPLSRYADAASISGFYDLHDFGSNVTLLHFTDCHAQLLPTYYREPSSNIGVGEGVGKPPHLVGDAFLRYYLISKDSRVAHADTYLDYARAARHVYRHHFGMFARRAYATLEPTRALLNNWHVDHLCYNLGEVAEGRIRRLNINVPPRSLKTILTSVAKTNRVVIVQEAVRRGGVASDIAASIQAEAFYDLDAPIEIVAGLNIPVPFNLELEKASVPQVDTIKAAIRKVATA